MKTIIKLAIASAVALAAATGGFAAEFTKGKVKKLDEKAKKVTIIHEELKGLDMPAMTMVFRIQDPAGLKGVKAGDMVRFQADRVNGQLSVVSIRKGK